MLEFLQKQKADTESFLAVLIEEQWITSSVWQIVDNKVNVVSTSNPTRWEEEMVNAVDTSISSAMQNLDENFKDPEKTVFGLPSSWIEGGNIKEEYLLKLKKVCDDLSLVPTGFVVLSEAIANYYKGEEGSGITGVVIGVSDQNLEISIFNLGNLVGVTNVARSISFEDDLTEGLVRLSANAESLPSRIVLFNQKEQELEDIKEILNGLEWSKIAEGKFVHTPRVEIFDPEKKIIAITLAGGSEMGAFNGLSTISDNTSVVKENTQDEGEILQEDNQFEETPLTDEIENVKVSEDLTAKDLGFEIQDDESINLVEKHAEPFKSKFVVPTMPKINNFKFRKPNFNFQKFNFIKEGKIFVIGTFSILSFLIFGLFIWWFYPKANITIYVSPKVLEESISINLNSSVDSQEIEVEVEKEKNKNTTGTKTVGDKAKGQVKIQNGTAFPINLNAGSFVVSTSDLKFVTLSAASVSGALSPTEPGVATIDVEASNIGSEYNLAKDEIFKVSNYPKAEVDATSVNTFSGGSSRQISAVSEEDRKSLLKSLKEELIEEAKEKLKSEINDDQILIDATINVETVDEDFSNKVGDEATNINLNLKLKVTAKIISKTSLSKESRNALEGKVPEGFVLRDDQLAYDFVLNDGSIDVNVKANLLPSLDSNEISKKISGKYINIAEEYLKSVPGFVRAEFRVYPMFPGKFGTLPHLSKRIDIEFSADK